MKIQINATGKIEDLPLKIAQRMINKGIAHIIKEEIKEVKIEEIKEISEPVKKKRGKKKIKKDKIEDSYFGYSDKL